VGGLDRCFSGESDSGRDPVRRKSAEPQLNAKLRIEPFRQDVDRVIARRTPGILTAPHHPPVPVREQRALDAPGDPPPENLAPAVWNPSAVFWPAGPCDNIRFLFGINTLAVAGGNKDRFGGVFRLAEVRLQDGETLENALRRFKRKVQQEDIIKEVKRHSFYLKPGEKLRVKQALARKRNRKKSRREVE
jgi:small subunit ribosomal protein S21